MFELKVDKLRTQATEQAEIVKQQESELNSKKEQLEGLRAEEQRLEKLKEENQKKLENLTVNLQDTQLNISQVMLNLFNMKNNKQCNSIFLLGKGLDHTITRANSANE